jgi:DNA polymerase/3'-5' exonuclease PolX
MTTGKSEVSLRVAKPIAEALRAILEPSCQRIVVAGSVRRDKTMVGDIELLAVPLATEQTDLFGGPVGSQSMLDLKLESLCTYDPNWSWDAHQPRRGEKWKRVTHVPSGLNVDIFVTTIRAWAGNLLIRTGPSAFGVHVVSTARRMNMHFADGFLLHRHPGPCSRGPACDLIIDVTTEEELMEALQLPWRTPQQRTGFR